MKLNTNKVVIWVCATLDELVEFLDAVVTGQVVPNASGRNKRLQRMYIGVGEHEDKLTGTCTYKKDLRRWCLITTGIGQLTPKRSSSPLSDESSSIIV